MKIRKLIEMYDNSINSINDKFEKVYELIKDWEYFDGKNLIKRNYGPFSSLAWFTGTECFNMDLTDENTINIFWYDKCDDYQDVDVPDMFFDDFDSYLEYVKKLVLENNKVEREKYNEYLRNIEKEQENNDQKQYQEFLRLKEIYEPQLQKSL